MNLKNEIQKMKQLVLPSKTKKGQAGSVMGVLLSVGMGLIIFGLVLGAGAIGLSAFGTGLTGTAATTVANASIGVGNLAAQAPNIGTIAGAVAIVALVIGGFAMYRGNSL